MKAPTTPLAVVCAAGTHRKLARDHREQNARNTLGVARLPAGLPAALQAAHERYFERYMVRRSHLLPTEGSAKLPYAKRAAAMALLNPVRDAALAAYESCSFRVCHSRWVEKGEHETRVVIDRRADVVCETDRVWSNNGKWSGLASTHRITIRASWRKNVESRGIAVVDGLLTLDAKPAVDLPLRDGEEVLEATWARQGRGTSLVVERGYLYRSPGWSALTPALNPSDGWLHAPSLRAARAQASRRSDSTPTPSERTAAVVRSARKRGEISRRAALRISKSCGLCRTGTLAWIETHFPGREAVPVEEVKAVLSGQEGYAQRWLAAFEAVTVSEAATCARHEENRR